MFFQYYLIIQLVGFLYIQNQIAYDAPFKRGKFFSISMYMFSYNGGDFLGKFTPVKYFNISSNWIIHGIPLSLLIPYVYFLYMLIFPLESASNPILRFLIIFLTGLLNGYNTNNLFN
jgi:hypothetical protein